MATQPDGFAIGEAELAEAKEEKATALAIAADVGN